MNQELAAHTDKITLCSDGEYRIFRERTEGRIVFATPTMRTRGSDRYIAWVENVEFDDEANETELSIINGRIVDSVPKHVLMRLKTEFVK